MTRQEITRPTSIDHELPHEPAATPNWSENYVFCGFDPEQAVGFYHHMARMPYDPEIWRGAFGMMLPDGLALLGKDHGRTGAPGSGVTVGPASPSLAFVCREPFRRWEVRYDGVARLVPAAQLTRGATRHLGCRLTRDEVADRLRFHLGVVAGGEPVTYVEALGLARQNVIEELRSGTRSA